jgi:hypothetical protein
MSSGCGLGRLLSNSEEKSSAFWQEVMARCGCETLEQFRALSPQQLFEAWQVARKELRGGSAATFPVTDGRFVVEGATAKRIPYMAGSTSHDIAPPHSSEHDPQVDRQTGTARLHLVF